VNTEGGGLPKEKEMADAIHGVEIKRLVTNTDARGYFREVIRVTDEIFADGFGQWSHSLMYHGVAKAWHVHQRQTDWWYVASGTIKVALYDMRSESPTSGLMQELFMGEGHDPIVLKIPPGVAHGCKVLGAEAHLFYVTSRTYDPIDEGRIPHDDPTIGYDWTAGPEIT
jgi:dTDP-4-dehydrorhamnose 3,5-epimerase